MFWIVADVTAWLICASALERSNERSYSEIHPRQLAGVYRRATCVHVVVKGAGVQRGSLPHRAVRCGENEAARLRTHYHSAEETLFSQRCGRCSTQMNIGNCAVLTRSFWPTCVRATTGKTARRLTRSFVRTAIFPLRVELPPAASSGWWLVAGSSVLQTEG